MRPLILALSTLALALASAAAADYDQRRATFGQITYRLSCAVCHGASGKGDGDLAGSLAVPAADLTSLQRRHGGTFPQDYVTKVIKGGAAVTVHGGQMPAWGLIFLKDYEGKTGDRPASDQQLVARRIGDLVEYLKKIQVP